MIDWAGLIGYDRAVSQRDRLFHEETEEDILPRTAMGGFTIPAGRGTNFTN